MLGSTENSVTAGHSLPCLWGQELAASVLSHRVGEVWVPQWSGALSASHGGLWPLCTQAHPAGVCGPQGLARRSRALPAHPLDGRFSSP